jgi:hypothetical protein
LPGPPGIRFPEHQTSGRPSGDPMPPPTVSMSAETCGTVKGQMT